MTVIQPPLTHSVIILQQKDGMQMGTTLKSMSARNESVNTVFVGWMDEEFHYSARSNYSAPFDSLFKNRFFNAAARAVGLKIQSPFMTGQMWEGSEFPEFQITARLETDSSAREEIRAPIVRLLRLVTPRLTDAQILGNPGTGIDYTQLWQSLSSSLPDGEWSQKIKSSVDSVNSTMNDFTSAVGKAAGVTSVSTVESAYNKSKTTSKTTNSSSQNTMQPTTAVADEQSNSFTAQLIRSGFLKNQVSIAIGMYLYFPSVVITGVECDLLNQIEYASGWPMSATVNISFRPMFLPTQDDLYDMFGVSPGEVM